jgi:hypothetical protein
MPSTEAALLSHVPDQWVDREAIRTNAVPSNFSRTVPQAGQRYSPRVRWHRREFKAAEARTAPGTDSVAFLHKG